MRCNGQELCEFTRAEFESLVLGGARMGPGEALHSRHSTYMFPYRIPCISASNYWVFTPKNRNLHSNFKVRVLDCKFHLNSLIG